MATLKPSEEIHEKRTMSRSSDTQTMHLIDGRLFVLGHREVKNTMLYIQLDKQLFQNFNEDQFITKVAHNVEESCSLIESNFEYITGEYNDGGKIFRKRK
jgi:hypothetical protein